MSAMGRFVSYHISCAYCMTEAAGDRLLIRITQIFDCLEVCQGFFYEQEPVFTNQRTLFMSEWKWRLLVVMYTKCVVRTCAALVMEVYDNYRL